VAVFRAEDADELRALGAFRVFDLALEEYLLYRGVDGAPDLEGAAWETFASLPHTTAALAAGHEYQFILRRRNRYGLLSLNRAVTSIELDGGGALVAQPPSDPQRIGSSADAAGTVMIDADYEYDADGTSQADAWLIYLTSNGADPVIGVTVPIEVAMVKADGLAKLRYSAGPYLEGAVIKAIVRTRRNGTPDVDSAGTTIYSATATLLGPAAPASGGAFLGTAAQQGT
jgi:hypothetical protein